MEQKYNRRWALVCWVLTFAFFGVGLFYASYDAKVPAIIWFALSLVWLRTAVVTMRGGAE